MVLVIVIGVNRPLVS